jgi:hypothetical protein
VGKKRPHTIDDAAEFMKRCPIQKWQHLSPLQRKVIFNLKQLITGLKKLGIKYVYDVSLGAEMTVALYHDAIEKGTVKTPLIATPCPAWLICTDQPSPVAGSSGSIGSPSITWRFM